MTLFPPVALPDCSAAVAALAPVLSEGVKQALMYGSLRPCIVRHFVDVSFRSFVHRLVPVH